MKRLEGKVAIVTGASRGIGKAIALAYGAEGAKVVATARTTKAIEALVAKLEEEGTEALAVSADLGREADIGRIPTETLARFGRIDILVNNAGLIHQRIDLVDFDVQLWRQVVDVNLTAPALLTKAVLPSMIGNRTGKIINISSIGGRKGGKGRSAYRATKAGLISLTESVASEVKKYGIDVNCTQRKRRLRLPGQPSMPSAGETRCSGKGVTKDESFAGFHGKFGIRLFTLINLSQYFEVET
jgi:3-oxoacyl-[acyl-carrier protein] reductase